MDFSGIPGCQATELQNNVRIYDYMLYAKWRWRNRVTRAWDHGDQS